MVNGYTVRFEVCLAGCALAVLSAAVLLVSAGSAWAADHPAAAALAAPLIARKVLFGNPDKASVRVSPDGTRISYLAPVDGVLNLWVGPIDQPDAAEPVTKDRKRGVRLYFWTYTNKDLIYLQDSDGDENWHAYLVNLDKKQKA